ncbi:hypothetical protein EYF80_056785 [Liparis tanakae]|uniref:Uncharacterized protein n=1 Tax=Liparis tanakae TaxID=230148 RepID=A0A4Z2EWP7_9TELE|nr:hypothetical protein EYF80_056785 [Liparis tanakae]
MCVSLTVVRDQALARPEQQVNFAASRLDQLDRPGVRDALGGLAVDLHYLVSNLRLKPKPHWLRSSSTTKQSWSSDNNNSSLAWRRVYTLHPAKLTTSYLGLAQGVFWRLDAM